MEAVIEYLNGQLNDNTQYAAFQRSFAEDGDYENEGFIKFITEKDYTVEIVVGILVPLFVVVVIALAIFIYRRRRRQNENLDGGIPMQKKSRRRTASRILGRGIGMLLCDTGKIKRVLQVVVIIIIIMAVVHIWMLDLKKTPQQQLGG